MKILVLSDLHLEFASMPLQADGADVVVLAGDIHLKTAGIEWARETFLDKPIVMVFGNHEFFGSKYPNLMGTARSIAAGTNVHVLENEAIEINGVRFLGCTLWTDFRLYGDPRLAGYFCQQEMTDFKKIRVAPRYSKLNPVDVARIHQKSLSWLNTALSAGKSVKNVVVTHHAPSALSLPELLSDDLTGAAYASNLEAFINKHPIDLWIHGHVHNSCDYRIGSTRVVCNPRGYSPDEFNPEFRQDFLVEV